MTEDEMDAISARIRAVEAKLAELDYENFSEPLSEGSFMLLLWGPCYVEGGRRRLMCLEASGRLRPVIALPIIERAYLVDRVEALL